MAHSLVLHAAGVGAVRLELVPHDDWLPHDYVEVELNVKSGQRVTRRGTDTAASRLAFFRGRARTLLTAAGGRVHQAAGRDVADTAEGTTEAADEADDASSFVALCLRLSDGTLSGHFRLGDNLGGGDGGGGDDGEALYRLLPASSAPESVVRRLAVAPTDYVVYHVADALAAVPPSVRPAPLDYELSEEHAGVVTSSPLPPSSSRARNRRLAAISKFNR